MIIKTAKWQSLLPRAHWIGHTHPLFWLLLLRLWIWKWVYFFTFYGLTLLKEKIKAEVAPQTNPAMPMKMPFGPKGFQDFDWLMPNLLMGNMPGFETMATSLMKKPFKNKGVATIEELRSICQYTGVKFIGCQMTMDVFGFSKDEFIEGVNIGGAATFLEFAMDADIQLFI